MFTFTSYVFTFYADIFSPHLSTIPSSPKEIEAI